MPLPTGDMQWPPGALAQITPRLDIWSAWYAGDPDQLTRAYLGGGTGQSIRPSQRSGGVVGAVSRWFWGQPTPVNEKRAKLHVPIASDLAMASADLLFAEQPTLLTDQDDQAKRERLDEILEANSWESLLLESAEVTAGLGGGFLRATWDQAVSDHVILNCVHADAAWPEFRFGRLWAVTFWRVVSSHDSIVVRHLERHERGRIEHGLFQGSETRLGHRIPLVEHPSTADLAVDETSSISTGGDLLTAVYVPNIRPNRLWRNDPVGAHLGRSDFAGLEGLMDAVDEAYSSWMRDVRLSKGRIIAAQHMLESQGRGQGALLDVDREVFVGLKMPPTTDNGSPITVQQFAVPSDKYIATIQSLLERIIGGAGYSLQTFGLDGDGAAATATEIAARERKTMTTREKKTRYWSTALVQLLQAAMQVEQHIFSGPGPAESLSLEFAPSVQPTQIELAQTAVALKAAQAASTKTRVAMVHPDWDEKAVDDEVALIIAEDSFTVPDIGPLPGDREPVGDSGGTVDEPQ